MGGIIDPKILCPLGTTPDSIRISQLESELKELRQLVQNFLKNKNKKNEEELRKILFPRGPENNYKWKKFFGW